MGERIKTESNICCLNNNEEASWMWMSKPIGQGFLHGSQSSCKHLANLLLFYKNRRSHHPVRACEGWGSQKDEAQYKQLQFKIVFFSIQL